MERVETICDGRHFRNTAKYLRCLFNNLYGSEYRGENYGLRKRKENLIRAAKAHSDAVMEMQIGQPQKPCFLGGKFGSSQF